MKARVDQDKCTSCGLCIEVCPEFFEWDVNDKARAKGEVVPPEWEEKVREASQGCPTEAIPIED